MRKDVKLGLAIGAILLAVIIVWAAVPRHAKKTVVLVPAATDSTQPPDQPATNHPTDTNSPATTDTHTGATPAPIPAPDVTTNAGGTGTAPKDSTDSKNASPDWARLLAASNVQDIHTMMGQSHASGVAPAVDQHDIPANDVENTADHDHGGMTFDSGEATTRPSSSVASGASSASRTHTVKTGETLASIAKSVYGKSGMYIAIEKANPSINPNRLKVGTVLTLPSANSESSSSSSSDSADTATPTRHSHASAAVNSSTEYRVQPGDSLHKIAVRLYGNAARADELYTSNKEVIGDDPAKLKVGEVLKLPEPPTATASR